MSKVLYNSVKRCMFCSSPEHCFTKSFTAENYEGKIVPINPYNQFWLCQNPACVFYIPVTVNRQMEMIWDRRFFWWRATNNTEMNIKLARRYDVKHGILNSYYG